MIFDKKQSMIEGATVTLFFIINFNNVHLKFKRIKCLSLVEHFGNVQCDLTNMLSFQGGKGTPGIFYYQRGHPFWYSCN